MRPTVPVFQKRGENAAGNCVLSFKRKKPHHTPLLRSFHIVGEVKVYSENKIYIIKKV